MSSALVKVLALGAGALITAGAVERGWRHGRERGDQSLGEFDANAIMRSTYTTSDDSVVDGLGSALRSSTTLDTGIMSSTVRGWHGFTGAVSEVAKKIVPLGVAALAYVVGGPIGWMCLAGLGLWGGMSVLQSSGIVGGGNTQRLDINM